MRSLIDKKRYNHGVRPSEHRIGEKSFLKDNGGAIPPGSVLEFSNTGSADEYQKHRRASKISMHPARMPLPLAEFFIKFLTDRVISILDPFAGSNTTGFAAERLGRRSVAVEPNDEYAEEGFQGPVRLRQNAPMTLRSPRLRLQFRPRDWQRQPAAWRKDRRGIVSVVTGAGRPRSG